VSRKNKIRMVALALALGLVRAAYAIEPFVIEDIRVNGLQRISAGTVFNYLPVKVGDTIDDTAAAEAIRVLFKTGFFKNVTLGQEGKVLIVTVDERPSIASLQFTGNKAFTEEALKDSLKKNEFAEGRVFNPSTLDKVEQEMKSQYFSLGKYAAVVKTTVTPLERNRVAISMDIDEGETARIKQINVVGNKDFNEETLLKKFSLGTKSIFAFFSKRDQYSKQKLAGDLETLRSFYQDQGYLDFVVRSTQVSITADKKFIFVTINITEGERYVVSEYKLAGKPLLAQEELLKLVQFKPGDVFSRKAVTASNKAISERLAVEGYAFANVNAIPEVNREAHKVAFTFYVEPGRRAYVRRVNIAGNTVTRDEVIRRELRQIEGAWFSAEQVRLSRIRLQRLGFFDEVTIETPQVPGSPDQVDINVSVKERPTGSLLFGVGYSDADGFLVQASVSQRNLFGTGKELLVSVDNSVVTDSFNIRYVDPYYTVNGVSRGIQLFATKVDAEEANTAEYITDTYGAALSYRIPLSEIHSINIGGGVERIKVKSTSLTPPEILAFIAQSPESDLFKINTAWARDTRNRYLFPNEGSLGRASLEIGVGDLDYYKFEVVGDYYKAVTPNLTFKVSGDFGYGDGFGDTDELPFFKNFFAGGASSVRGYKARSLGPRDSGTTPEPLGGSKLLTGNLELQFPMFGVEQSNDKRLALFVDGGYVWGPGENVDTGDLRYSTGLAFYWVSPLGPMSVSYAVPLNDKSGDETEGFQFTLGRVFR